MAETEAKIKDVQLGEELSKRYLSYAMSTIVSRSQCFNISGGERDSLTYDNIKPVFENY